MGWFDHWIEDEIESSPLSHWDEDFSLL